ncbi:hypothetical protein SDC9_21694 [bioreactor metagenome]|uniref:DNA polymerase III delta N-terminal domain-containing protein n=1 Tax=bioreactor metagenome TaxID=1076179 RepID=A0A644UA61_9ZZZZ|nr:hypothetical protein [Candidatus Elulimicrobiales bacterium]
MLYIIFGTNFKKREVAREKIRKTLSSKKIDFEALLEVPKINKENFTLLANYFGGASLFGEKVLINVEDILTKEDSREYVYKNIEDMIYSDNVFILDEPFALTATFQKLERDLDKLNLKENLFDCRETLTVKDVEPFYLCELIEKRDKKAAWQEWKKLYLEWEDSEAQAIHGALWWKWKMMWSAYLDGDRNNFFKVYRLNSKELKYSKKELEEFGKEISLMAMKANNGELDLMRGIEKFILKI